MIRFGAHLSGLERQLLNHLANANAAAAGNALRLATGKKINAPRDDPAAFFQISSLQSRLSDVNNTANRITAASTVAAQAQLNLDLVRTQLNAIRTELIDDNADAPPDMCGAGARPPAPGLLRRRSPLRTPDR